MAMVYDYEARLTPGDSQSGQVWGESSYGNLNYRDKLLYKSLCL